jgi:4-amino-4-deoxy-L-arabinose transferase-like glycosyltransferase
LVKTLTKPGTKGKTEGASRWFVSPAWIAGAGVGLLAFVLYLLTLAPTILYYTDEMKDSAVLPTIAYTLGISHPTGYPTYTILTHLFTYLPVGDVAYRVNLASAVFGALAVAALYGAGLRLGRSIPAALAGALALGTSPLFWSQAVIAEVYTLHILFLVTALLVLLVWREKREDKYLLLAAAVIGLAMTHNLTSGLLLPTAAAFVLLVEPRKILDWKIILKGIGVFLASLLPYAYLPIRARMDPVMNVEDPSNWERFKDLVTGGEFKANMWAFGPEELPARVAMYLDYLTDELHWALLIAAVAGVAYTLLRDRAAFALLALPYAGFLIYALEYDIEDIHYYFIPTYAILAVWASAGLATALRGASRLGARTPKLRTTAVVALSILALSIPLWGLPETYRTVDRSEDYEGRRILEAVVENTAPNAIVLQHRGPLKYMELVEGRRTDIQVWNFAQPNGQEEGVEAYNAIQEGRFYILYPNKGKTRQFEDGGYKLVPVEGKMLYRVDPGEGA